MNGVKVKVSCLTSVAKRINRQILLKLAGGEKVIAGNQITAVNCCSEWAELTLHVAPPEPTPCLKNIIIIRFFKMITPVEIGFISYSKEIEEQG